MSEEALRGLESDICDLLNMARVTSDYIDDMLAKNFKKEGLYRLYTLTEEQFEAAQFCVWDVRGRAQALHTAFYEAVEAGR